MTKSEKGTKFSLIAAMCYEVFALCNIISRVTPIVASEIIDISIVNEIACIVALGKAVALFTKNKKAVAAVAAVSAIIALFSVCRVVAYYHESWNRFGGKLLDIFYFAAYASAAILTIFSLRGKSVVKRIWFIPAALMFLGSIFVNIYNNHMLWSNYDYSEFLGIYFMWDRIALDVIWDTMALKLLEIVALFFVGLWLKADAAPEQTASANKYAVFDPHTVYSAPVASPVIGGADKLKMYKELLDSGTISQEEFDAKKKQILSL